MACGLALKRPHEYESYLAEDGFASEAKRARTTAHCAPFRPQMGTIAASLPSTSTFAKLAKGDDNSPFASVSRQSLLTSSQLDAYLRSEIKNLRKRKLIPKRTLADSSNEEKSNKVYRTSGSPAHSDSDGEGFSACSSTKKDVLYTKPQFNLREVHMICERLLNEQEMRLRQEYEVALTKKLEDQHEQYVQFASEQFSQKVVDSCSDDYAYSYLS